MSVKQVRYDRRSIYYIHHVGARALNDSNGSGALFMEILSDAERVASSVNCQQKAARYLLKTTVTAADYNDLEYQNVSM
jgi:hypothetical protein